MAAPTGSSFEDAVRYAQANLGIADLILKEKQIETLRNAYSGKDAIAVLPTGYGKSVVFQMLPWMLQKCHNVKDPLITIVVCPLNSIIEDQVVSLAERGVRACYLNISGTSAKSYEIISGSSEAATNYVDSDSDESSKEAGDEEVGIYSEKTVNLAALKRGEYFLIYSHPEALVANNAMGKILRSSVFKSRLGAIVIDEVHMVTEWGDKFRTAFAKLADLNALFPNAVHLAFTATLTQKAINQLTESLQLQEPAIVQLNPDRPNIYLELKRRLPNIHKLDKYDDLIHPLFLQLKEELSNFPVTFVYVDSLDALWYSYRYLEQNLGKDGYIPGKPQCPETRIFAMYHKDYTQQMKSLIIKELRKVSPVIRLVLATVALGMGLNAPSVSRVIHYRPPTDLEKYKK